MIFIIRSLPILICLLFQIHAQAGSHLQDTTDMALVDTTELADEECNNDFLTALEKPVSDTKVKLITKSKKVMTLKAFMMESIMIFASEYGFADLDKDGKKELLITNFTGGAHCCDEVYFFKLVGPNTYQYVTKTYGGSVCVMSDTTFTFSFYEPFGYFFTCYACAYNDTTDIAPLPVESIALKYKRGKLTVIPGDTELRSQINDNLGKLSEQPYEKLNDDIDQDNGLRKAFALNLVVYYYSFGRNLLATKTLFDKYYKFPDKKVVWTEFLRVLKSVQANNNF